MNNKEKAVCGVVFYDQEGNIVVQERNSETRKAIDEKYSFWGGGMESGESPMDAVKRELLEELNYSPKELEYFDKFEYDFVNEGEYEGLRIIQHVCLSPITDKLLNSKVLEGKSTVTLPIDEAIQGEGFVKNATNFLIDVKAYLYS